MQYVLTEKEIQNLVPKVALQNRIDALEVAREKILELTGFVCIHIEPSIDPVGLCDDCPCSSIHDDNDDDLESWEMICPLKKEYSQ